MKKIQEIKNINEVKCPYCGGEINWKNFTGYEEGGVAMFIAGCWSGDLNKETPEHIFKIAVEVDQEVCVVVQKKKEVD